MSNDDVYASGLLNRALDPSTQPEEIRAFMQAEIDLLDNIVTDTTAWLDVGCGTGRHLALFRARVRFGVGVDYEQTYVIAAHRHVGGPQLYFITGDATQLPLSPEFDLATCMMNTWGTMNDKHGVLAEMRRCARRRVVSVFSERSSVARREWYRRLGHPVIEESPQWLMTEGGFRSEHFTEARLRALIGDCTVYPCTNIGYIVSF